MARRPNRVKVPDPGGEDDLRAACRRIATLHREARTVLRHRDQIAWRLFHDAGYTQRDLADIANEYADPRLTEDAFQKAFSRLDAKEGLARSA